MRFDVVPAPPDTVPESGVLWRATLASVEVGKQLVQLLEDRIGRAITEELG
jgi:hypothetical protein